MLTKRIIPCLDVKNGRVVKGVNFVSLRDAGDPVECAKQYNMAGADELVFLDITATLEARDTVVEMARRVADEVFIPFTVGVGIRTTQVEQCTSFGVSFNQQHLKPFSSILKAISRSNSVTVPETDSFLTHSAYPTAANHKRPQKILETQNKSQ